MNHNHLLAAGAISFALVGCSQDASKVDLDEPKVQGDLTPRNFEAVSPDAITVFLNVDNHPTIVRVCLDGIAFRTISSTHSGGIESGAVARIPEWDAFCEEID